MLLGQDPEKKLDEQLSTMLDLARQLVEKAGDSLWRGPLTETDRDALYSTDQRINQLQQQVRKDLVGRLELSTAMQRARFLVIMGMIKDVERLGDYAKNLFEAGEMLQGPLPEDQLVYQLEKIRREAEDVLRQTHQVLANADEDAARDLIQRGHEVSRRCESLIKDIAQSDHTAAVAVPLALATRYYKRIQKHTMNVLSTLVMPLHKVDYFNGEQSVREARETSSR
jgi:phosphate uptake regulator